MSRLAEAIVITALVASVVTGCGTRPLTTVDPAIRVAAARPPAPATWPRYPQYSATSCWTRALGGRPLRAAPSVPVPAHPPRVAPEEVVRRLLERLGDRRYVHRVAIAPPPRVTLRHLHGYFAGARPPANALWAYVAAPAATTVLPAHPRPRRAEAAAIAGWEAALVVGALRDDFCAAGGAPLVGWSIGRGGFGISDGTQALEQRFPNPSPAAFRRRVALVGRRYGFGVAHLRLLHPRQLAPLVVVRTNRDRKAFVRDVPAILRLLDPTSSSARGTAITFEGFFFEAEDSRGPFVRTENVYRGESEGGEWSWSRCSYPFPHSEPAGTKPCS